MEMDVFFTEKLMTKEINLETPRINVKMVMSLKEYIKIIKKTVQDILKDKYLKMVKNEMNNLMEILLIIKEKEKEKLL